MAIPVVTHGPDGDQRLIQDQTLKFSVNTTPGASFNVFNENTTNLGTGALTGLATQGMSAATPGSTTTALSCTDSFWDVNFVVRQSCNTIGDTVTVFLDVNGTKTPLMTLVVEAGGARVTQVADYFTTSDRGLSSQLPVNTLLPFSAAGGTQTQLITFSMGQSLMVCGRLGAEISRGSGAGVTSVVFSDVVVSRNDSDGGMANGPGINADGSTSSDPNRFKHYPTGLLCPANDCPSACMTPPTVCPTPPPTVFCFGGINTGVRAEATVSSISSSGACFTIKNTSTSGTTGTITNIGFDLPGERPNTYALTSSTNSNYFVAHDLSASSGAQQFVDTFDFVLHNKSNGTPTFGGGSVANGIAPGQSASFCVTGDFSGVTTAAQFAATIYPRFQEVNNGGSDVARNKPCQ